MVADRDKRVSPKEHRSPEMDNSSSCPTSRCTACQRKQQVFEKLNKS